MVRRRRFRIVRLDYLGFGGFSGLGRLFLGIERCELRVRFCFFWTFTYDCSWCGISFIFVEARVGLRFLVAEVEWVRRRFGTVGSRTSFFFVFEERWCFRVIRFFLCIYSFICLFVSYFYSDCFFRR